MPQPKRTLQSFLTIEEERLLSQTFSKLIPSLDHTNFNEKGRGNFVEKVWANSFAGNVYPPPVCQNEMFCPEEREFEEKG